MPKTHSCNMRLRSGDVPIGELDLDPIDFGFLTAVRFFCLAFAEPEQQAWTTAFLASGSFFPDPGSADAMRRTLAVIHEVRTARKSVFRFSNPRCAGCSGVATHDERHLVQLIQASRKMKAASALPSAMFLCEGNDSTRLKASAEDFAQLFTYSMERD